MQIFLLLVVSMVWVPGGHAGLPHPSVSSITSVAGTLSNGTCGDGMPASLVVCLHSPFGVAYSAQRGLLWITQVANNSIRSITTRADDNATVSTPVSDHLGHHVPSPKGITYAQDALYICSKHRILRFDLLVLAVSRFAGSTVSGDVDNAPSANARFHTTQGIAFEKVFYFTDRGNNAVRVLWQSSSMVTTIAQVNDCHSVAVSPRSIVGYVTSFYLGVLYRVDLITGDINTTATTASGQVVHIKGPTHLAVVRGQVYISCQGDATVRLLENGAITALPLSYGNALESRPTRPAGLAIIGQTAFLVDTIKPRLYAFGIKAYVAVAVTPSQTLPSLSTSPTHDKGGTHTVHVSRSTLSSSLWTGENNKVPTESRELRTIAERRSPTDSDSLTVALTDRDWKRTWSGKTRGRKTTTIQSKSTATLRETTTVPLTPRASHVDILEPRTLSGDTLTDADAVPRPALRFALTDDTWESDLASVRRIVLAALQCFPRPVNGTTCTFDEFKNELLPLHSTTLSEARDVLTMTFHGTEKFSSKGDTTVVLGHPLQGATRKRLEPILTLRNSITISPTSWLTTSDTIFAYFSSSLTLLAAVCATPSALTNVQIFSLTTKMRCLPPFSRRLATATSWTLSPLYAIAGDMHDVPPVIGMMLWNLILVAIVLFCILLLLLFFRFKKKQSWENAMVSVMFPNVGLGALYMLIPGTIPAALQSFALDIFPSYRFIAIVTLIAIPGVMFGNAVHYVRTHLDVKSWHAYQHDAAHLQWFLPRGAWLPEPTVKTHGLMFAAFMPDTKYFVAVEVAALSLVSFVVGLEAESTSACRGQSIVVIVVLAVWSFVLVFLQPYRIRIRAVTRFFVLTVLWVGALLAALGEVVQGTYLALIIFSILDVMVVVYALVWEKRNGIYTQVLVTTNSNESFARGSNTLRGLLEGEEMSPRKSVRFDLDVTVRPTITAGVRGTLDDGILKSKSPPVVQNPLHSSSLSPFRSESPQGRAGLESLLLPSSLSPLNSKATSRSILQPPTFNQDPTTFKKDPTTFRQNPLQDHKQISEMVTQTPKPLPKRSMGYQVAYDML